MQYRKEPILFLLAIALGAWVVFGSASSEPDSVLRVSTKDAESTTSTETLLASPRPQVAVPDRNAFVEPSEAVPLPPRTLLLPELGPVPFVRPPAVPGQHVRAWHQLRVPAPSIPETPVNFAAADPSIAAGATSSTSGSSVRGTDIGGRDPFLASQFDWIKTNAGTYWGQLIEPKGEARFDAVASQRLNQRVSFLWLNQDRESSRFGQPVRREPLVFDPTDPQSDQLLELRLAGTLQNEIGLRKVQIPDGMDSLPQRKAFLEWLLAQARTDTSAYAEAEEQAKKIVEYTQQGEDGYVWLVRVYRAQGQLEREWKLYSEVGNGSPPAWVLRGRGEIEARLTLWEDAERDLRAAVELDGRNLRSRASLGRFLLEQGRVYEALVHTAEAFRLRTLQPDIAEDVIALHVKASIAAGQLDDAKDALDSLEAASGGGSAIYHLMAGALAHARGDASSAAAEFTAAQSGGGEPEALLDSALANLPGGDGTDWQAIHDQLVAAGRRAPVYRGESLAGLSTLFAVTGNFDRAVQSAEEARTVDPSDAYTYYAAARAMRLAGNLEGAVAMVEEGLRSYGDSADLVAELVAALVEQHEQIADLDALRRAARYSERLLDLDRDQDGKVRTVRFVELRGLITYRLEDFAAARAAFDSIKDRSYFARLGLAVIAYRQRRVDDARQMLLTIVNDLDVGSGTAKVEARRLLDDIDDHSEKEVVRDDFTRNELGSRWIDESMGRIGVSVENDRLVIKGKLGREYAYARRTTPSANKFLRAEATMRIDGGASDMSDLAGLRITMEGRGRRGFSTWLGVRRSAQLGLRAVLVVPNDERGDEADANKVIDLTDRLDGPFDPYAEHELALEVIEPEDKRGSFGIRALWNGRVVAELGDDEVGRGGLSTSSRGELGIDLYVEGREGVDVHVSFDDFELTRRREN